MSAVGQRESSHQRGEKFAMEMLSVEVLNQIAFVKARCPMLGFSYFDYLSLARDGDRWLITNKLFTHWPTDPVPKISRKEHAAA